MTVIGCDDSVTNTCIVMNGSARANTAGSIYYNGSSTGSHIFNTYEVKINKATEKLRDSHLWFLSSYDFHIQTWYYREAFKKIHKELITNFLKPLVISDKDYMESSSRVIKIYNENHKIY
jgi:hypothetical protein